MSDALDLLNSLSEDEITTYLADAEAEPHIVIGKDRYIVVPEELKRIAVQYDHNIETVTFDCPRFWDEHDMSKMKVFINYLRPDNQSGCYEAQNLSVDENDPSIMHFTWTISKNVTQASGSLTILVCVKRTNDDGNEENHWNSERNSDMRISPGMECGETIVNQYPDVLDQWEKEVLETLGEQFQPQPSVMTLYADGWVVEDDIFFQVVEIEGVTEFSRVDLQPTPLQLSELIDKGISMTAVNDGGVVTVYAIGSAPTSDMTIQVFITEVVST